MGRPAMRWATESLIDTKTYPVHEHGSDTYMEVIGKARRGLEERNCAILEGFVSRHALETMQAEAHDCKALATYTEKWLNPYFSEPPDDVSQDHPLKRFSLRTHGMIRADRFDRSGAIWSLFQNADLCRLVADCLWHETLHPYGDPFGSVNVNVQQPGSEFAWHFDHNDFTISVLLEEPEQDGVFEYVPDIRSMDDPCNEEVQKVLDGERERVHTLAPRPGGLQLFRGGNTLHRVTAPQGGKERLSLLLSYVTDPGHIATAEYARRLWGEAHPLHPA